MWKASFLIEALHRRIDVSPYVTSPVSLMRRGYSPFTHWTIVSSPPDGRRTFMVPVIAILTGYRAGTLVAPGPNGELRQRIDSSQRRGRGARSEGPHGAFRAEHTSLRHRRVPRRGRGRFRDRVPPPGRKGLRSPDPAAPWGESAQR